MSSLSELTAARPSGLSDEEAEFLDVAAAIADEEIERQASAIDVADAVPAALIDLLFGQELHALAVPEKLGGAGARPLLAVLVVERLAEASAAVGCLVGEAQAAAAALAAAHLPVPVAAAPAVADGGAGVFLSGGSLSGRVELAVGVRAGAPVVVLAGGGDAAFFALVSANVVGFADSRSRTGLRGLARIALDLEGVVPDAVGGAEGVSAGRLHRGLVHAACAVGVGRRAVAESARYLQARSQFGRPLADFGALRRILADAAADVASASSLLHEVAAGASESPAPVAQAARVATVAAVGAADSAIQLHGGYGYVREYLPERLLRDALSLRALAGGRLRAPAVESLLEEFSQTK